MVGADFPWEIPRLPHNLFQAFRTGASKNAAKDDYATTCCILHEPLRYDFASSLSNASIGYKYSVWLRTLGEQGECFLCRLCVPYGCPLEELVQEAGVGFLKSELRLIVTKREHEYQRLGWSSSRILGHVVQAASGIH